MLKAVLPLVLLALAFVTSAYLAQVHGESLRSLVEGRLVLGVLIYTGIAITTTVIAPLSSVPLMPVAASLWGAFVAAIASIVGWLIGAAIAFWLSRRYGRMLVSKMISEEKLASIEKRVPQENLFWSIVLLRMAVPVDVLSYALGLFSTIPLGTYIFATLLGIAPFAFILAYAGTLPLTYQALLAAILLPVVIYIARRRK